MDWIMIPLNFAIVFGTVYKVTELFARRRERQLLISKLSEISNVDFKGITLYNSGNKYTALRIGWLLLGIGLGLLSGFLLNMMATGGEYALDFERTWRYHDYVAGIVYAACICVFGGFGLLMSYSAERKAEHPEEKKEDTF